MNGTALVTGGSKRIGRSIALSLADNGFNIALHYSTSRTEAEEVAKDIERKKRQCCLFSCDFNKMEQITSLIPEVLVHFPDCNLLVNNASIFERARLMETDLELFDRHFNINFKTPFFLSRDFARHCSKGQIINILDTKISKTIVEYFVYSLTKKALFEFTRMAAKELGPHIRVNSISPGMILPSTGHSEDDLNRMSKNVPLQRKGDLESVVSAVLFLVKNSYITGECIFVDGGEHLT